MASVPPEQAEDVVPRRQGAGVLFRNACNQILLVEPTYKPHWEIPGGLVEHGESPLEAAVREVREELSLDVAPRRLLCVDYVSHTLTRDGAEGLMFVFDGGVLPPEVIASITLPSEELRSFAWWVAEDLGQVLSTHMAQRVRHAATSAESTTTLYLENGEQMRTPR